jgi:hypothetical protein
MESYLQMIICCRAGHDPAKAFPKGEGKKERLCPLLLRDKGVNYLCGTTLVPFLQTALDFAVSGKPGAA